MPVRKMADVTISPFEDSPQPAEMEKILNRWQELRLPPGLERHIQPSGRENMVELFKLIRDQISSIKGTRYKNRLEVQIIGWLYDLIRQNVKRGRVFDLRQVLVQGKADCTGYSKLFTLQGRMCGLDAGAVDVVIDNGGRCPTPPCWCSCPAVNTASLTCGTAPRISSTAGWGCG
jgi:hypothetical protein